LSFLRFAWEWLTRAQQWHGAGGIPARLLEHLEYTGLALVIAALIALPLGVLIGHTGRAGFAVISVANFARALPTLGLLVLAYVVTAGSSAAWLVPLAALAIPPILVNAYEGVLGVPPEVKDAARGMGMTGPRILRQVEIPIALPLILLGLRTAAIQVVATATLAAYIGLGGLGRYIVDGLASHDYAQVAGGAALVIVLALAVQAAFVVFRRFGVPRGLRGTSRVL
jgi:osmoprotectant transport system permease protein